MAFAVCEEIYSLLRDQYSLKNHWITIYQCFEPEGNRRRQKRYCKMIAYANASKQEPLSYQEEYIIPARKHILNDIELHTKIFAGDDTTPRILMTQAEIRKEFKHHKIISNISVVHHTFILIEVKRTLIYGMDSLVLRQTGHVQDRYMTHKRFQRWFYGIKARELVSQ